MAGSSEICRLCLEPNENLCHSIQSVAPFLQKAFQIEIDMSPDLPSMFCDFCSQRLKMVEVMWNNCIKSQSYFSKKIQNDEKYPSTFRCCLCNLIENNFDSFKDHCTTMHGILVELESQKNISQCLLCKENFDSPEEFSLHQSTLDFEDDKIDEYEEFLAEEVETTSSLIHCNICQAEFCSLATLFKHFDGKHKDEQGTFQCLECEKSYSRWNSLKYHHHQMHNEKNKFQCLDCGKIFFRRNLFQEHRNIHLNLRPFECAKCKATFTSSGALRSHMRSHTKVKPFSCKICNKAYSHYSDMKRHSYIHTGNYPFNCHICKKHFAQKRTYLLHQSLHVSNAAIESSQNEEGEEEKEDEIKKREL